MSTDNGPAPTRTVERALTLLVEVATNDGLGLVDLARRVNLSPATALRLLRTLEATEFVRRDEEGAYHGASRLIQVAVTFMSSVPLYRLAEPHLAALRDEAGESAYLGVAGPQETVLYARLAESDKSIRHRGWLGKTVPLHGTAIGTALRDQCGEQGYFSESHTLEDGVTAIAATVHWPDGSVAAAMSVVGPTFRLPDAQVQKIGNLVASRAQALSRELGGPDYDEASASADH
ncbi:IclR family transcriptional regulator C-terminal domain-containing protein [Spongiactinospora sp. TRM90649]|uniref:IclR family transcriptional regulator n=1 Tax=Spongiactinospora sp. TRM90649 TaxID=3031114 RepID=UPI0023F680FD|nr:IclR family transcriptional regulator C-terminal domain-containing protein [Spongiactinospora sp. TRM90649]MDF5757722.1 IclR family transcriptional regulator C-terminal domain-containing protein [Spongiactinospora sp. TRM90649]